MADTTIPTTPPTQDLEINLAEAPKMEEKAPEKTPAELDLSLDLNLPEAPKTDDRLKTEDEKNQEVTKPAEEEKSIEPTPEEANPVEKAEEIQAPVIENLFAEMPVVETTPVENPTPVTEEAPKSEEIQEEKTEREITAIPEPEKVEEVKTEEAPVKEIAPSTSIEEVMVPVAKIEETVPQTLESDIKIIDALEGHASAWGLSPEAVVKVEATPVEAPKTFDLDTMLGTPPPSTTPAPINEISAEPIAQATPTPVEISTMPNIMTMPEDATTQVPPSAFTILTTQPQVSAQAIPQITIPAKKTSGVKTLLFVVLFAALGFTTYFIVQTMYPLETGKLFWGGDTTQMHASEEVVIDTWANLTGETEAMSGEATEETTGDIWEMESYGELDNLGTATSEGGEEETDLSKLADYVNKGNDLRDQGKTLNNNTIIKYGLYISKKATDLLEKIAKGEEISNLSWYFAQFDKYIEQLETLMNSADQTTNNQEVSSPAVEPTNEIPTETTEPIPAPTANPFVAE